MDELRRLRALADQLEVGEKALAVYGEIFELDPDDVPAANMIGRSLQALGRDDDALEHWRLVAELQRNNEIAADRLRSLRHRSPTPSTLAGAGRTRGPRRTPAEIVEPNLAGPGRDVCLRFLAGSIRMTERIDAQRLAVTDRPTDGRFRVSGGKGSGVTPWRGMLCVFVHAPSMTPDVTSAVLEAGGQVVFDAGGLKSLPESMEYGIRFEHVADVVDVLERPHREHLLRSIAAGPPPWGHLHDPALRDYIVEQAST